MLKSKIPIFTGGRGVGGLVTNFWEGGCGVGGGVGDQLLMLSQEMLKSKIPIFTGGGWGLVTNF